jgi:hypothetical protein
MIAGNPIAMIGPKSPRAALSFGRAKPANAKQDQTRENRRPGGAVDPEVQAENEQRIEKSRCYAG